MKKTAIDLQPDRNSVFSSRARNSRLSFILRNEDMLKLLGEVLQIQSVVSAPSTAGKIALMFRILKHP